MRWMDFVDALLSPLGFGLLLALVLWRGRRRISRGVLRVGIAIEILCFVLATPLGANMLVGLQESRAPTPASCAAPEPRVVVVLSGGTRRKASDAGDFDALNTASLQRTLVAARLAKHIGSAELVISGGGRRGIAQSTLMAGIAQDLGVPADTIRTETASTTTWENATRVRALQPALPSRIWLVTSAVHMPRALLAFRAAGFDACAYPADFRYTSPDSPADVLPSAGAIGNADAVLHELVGELVYRLRAL